MRFAISADRSNPSTRASICGVGLSKSGARASRTAERPSIHASKCVRLRVPSGETAPTPVISTRG